ncbi:tRNA dimethylallyltransferase isoform X2 [Rhodnius prolixus]|uniref:U1-type domain-containing protein n=3 Tax=Rhodnius prolixus TaxID=13249 RepID=A0ABL0EK16_RHOPR
MVPHHLLNFLDPLERYTVVDFRDAALPIIRRLHEKKKLPVVVGGTHYYIESLLWQVLVEDIGSGLDYQIPNEHVSTEICSLFKYAELLAAKCQEELDVEEDLKQKENHLRSLMLRLEERSGLQLLQESTDTGQEAPFKAFSRAAEEFRHHLITIQAEMNNKLEKDLELCVSDLRTLIDTEFSPIIEKLNLQQKKIRQMAEEETNLSLHNRLRSVDPEMARCLHPNNTRKILRSLQVFAQRKRPHSEILKEQQTQRGGSHLGGPIRFPNSVMFWIDADSEILDGRLNARVDDMIERGLVEELLDFHRNYNLTRIANKDTSKAYTQGIFQSIGFKEFHNYLILNEEERNSEKGKKLLFQGIEDLKTVTKKYARKQCRWIQNRFLKAGNRQVPPVYYLNATDLSRWDDLILNPAVAVVSQLLDPNWKGCVPAPLARNLTPLPSSKGENYCTVCQRVFIGDLQWQAHLSSNKHKRMLKKRQRQESPEEPLSKKNQHFRDSQGKEEKPS